MKSPQYAAFAVCRFDAYDESLGEKRFSIIRVYATKDAADNEVARLEALPDKHDKGAYFTHLARIPVSEWAAMEKQEQR